jgi:CheY-like chemotaxis protein
MLQQHGYTVLFAADGETALKLFRLHGHPIDLLLCDIVMPRLSGPELAKLVRALRPDIPILFISGLTQETSVKDWIQSGARFLRKPIAQDQLVQHVTALIGPTVGSA